jgi:NAD-dependent DNA ligase
LIQSTISLASSLANAVLGTKVSITGAGTTADAALTPAALAGVVVKAQMSNDGTNYTDISGDTVTISAAGSILWDLGAVTYRYLRILETPSTGALNLTLNFNAKNDF